MSTVLMYAAYAGAAVAWIGAGYTWLQVRRWRRLNALMDHLVFKAWQNRHLPIWAVWSAGTGQRITVVLEETDQD